MGEWSIRGARRADKRAGRRMSKELKAYKPHVRAKKARGGCAVLIAGITFSAGYAFAIVKGWL